VTSGFLDAPRPLAFAHRGGSAHRQENSWRAFEHAVGLGYRYLETDARATADGVLLAFHDESLDRVTGQPGRVAQLPYRTVAAARIGGSEPIPLLADLLGSWPQARFNIDVKHPGAITPLAEVLRHTAAWDRVCICSFSGARLRAARRSLGRAVCLAAPPAVIAAVAAAGPGARPATRDVHCAQIPARLATPRFIRRAHALGLQVHAWTVNDPGEMTALLDAGVDGLISDETVLLRDVLARRGQWHPAAPGPGVIP
jgi:glycerophosphoryl diester phosphodiesterase